MLFLLKILNFIGKINLYLIKTHATQQQQF